MDLVWCLRMKRTLLKSFFLFLLLVLFCSQAVAGVEYVTVEVKGVGTTEKEAIYDALKGALGQVNGLQMSAQSETSLKAIIKSVNDNDSEYFEEKLQKKINTATKGTIKQYTIVSKQTDPNMNNNWVVVIDATIAKYVVSQQTNRLRMAVIPFKASNPGNELKIFSSQLTQAIISFLTQTRKFAVLDREFSSEQQKELDFFKKEDTPPEEMSRVGNRVGADFIVIGKIEKLIQRTNTITLKRTGKKISTTQCGAEVSFRVIDVATGQIVLSDLSNRTKKNNGSSCNHSAIALMVASTLGNQILEAIFPVTVVSVNDKFVTLGQGGKTIRRGQRFNLIEYGRKITDPYTGETLGREETSIGLIEVVDVQAKISRAKIIKIDRDIEKNFVPGKFIIRTVKFEHHKKRNHDDSKKQERVIDKSSKNNNKRGTKRISKDDW